jgi:hypothetical protein
MGVLFQVLGDALPLSLSNPRFEAEVQPLVLERHKKLYMFTQKTRNQEEFTRISQH